MVRTTMIRKNTGKQVAGVVTDAAFDTIVSVAPMTLVLLVVISVVLVMAFPTAKARRTRKSVGPIHTPQRVQRLKNPGTVL